MRSRRVCQTLAHDASAAKAEKSAVIRVAMSAELMAPSMRSDTGGWHACWCDLGPTERHSELLPCDRVAWADWVDPVRYRSRHKATELDGTIVSAAGDGLVDIVVVDPGTRPIPIYDAVRRFTRLNVKQARKLVDTPPQAIITQVPLRQAEALKIELEAFGGTLELRPAEAPGAPTDLLQ